jgi:hypothetical protein
MSGGRRGGVRAMVVDVSRLPGHRRPRPRGSATYADNVELIVGDGATL